MNGFGTILVVDDLAPNRRLLSHLLMRDGYLVVTAADGEEALAAVAASKPDLVLMDIRMPGRDGFSVCQAIKGQDVTRLLPVVLMTGSTERADRVRAIESGADDFLTKPVDELELRARVRSLVRLKRYTDDLDSAEAVIISLARTIEARDAYTEGHCERLAQYAVIVGRRLGLGADELAALYRGGYLHDIGKIAVPDAILCKPGPLTAAEREIMKRHTTVGDHLCGNLRALAHVRPIVRHHHERLDGSGYPDGLRGDAIPLLAQIIGVVDVFDALTTVRPYKPAVDVTPSIDELRRDVDRGWRDARLVDALAGAVADGELALDVQTSNVELTTEDLELRT
ncbi:MAG: HD domain-containing phosphohydrolase [Acidobacteriota bacterium]